MTQEEISNFENIAEKPDSRELEIVVEALKSQSEDTPVMIVKSDNDDETPANLPTRRHA